MVLQSAQVAARPSRRLSEQRSGKRGRGGCAHVSISMRCRQATVLQLHGTQKEHDVCLMCASSE